jgi:hypothetical protein
MKFKNCYTKGKVFEGQYEIEESMNSDKKYGKEIYVNATIIETEV